MRYLLKQIIVIALVALAIVVGVKYINHTIMQPTIAREMAHRAFTAADKIPYKANAIITVRYCGRVVKSKAVITHQRDSELIAYTKGMWSLRRGATSYTYMPTTNTVLVSQSSPRITSEQWKRFDYNSIYSGTEQIAGRDTVVVQLVSRSDNRPSKKLWIDRTTAAILKSIDYSSRGDELGGMEITSIDFKPKIGPQELTPKLTHSAKKLEICRSANLAELRKTLGFEVKEPQYVPKGFQFEGRHLFTSQCACNRKSAQLTYTDGLNIISVFEIPTKTSCAMGCCGSRDAKPGACKMQGCEMAGSGRIMRKDKMVVVVGDLLPDEIRKIAESVD